MADVNLDDLFAAKAKEMATNNVSTNAIIEPKDEIAKITKDTELITPQERARIDEIKDAIDLTNSQTSIQYGINAQRNIAEFSDSILTNVRAKDSGYVGDLLNDLVSKVRGFDVDNSNKGSFLEKIPLFGSLVSKAKDMKASYDKLSVQVDRIQGELDKSRTMMLKDIVTPVKIHMLSMPASIWILALCLGR